MKKLSIAFVAALSFSFVGIVGCGPGETKVIEAPPETPAEDSAVEGTSDDNYNEEMEKSMQQQGN